MHRIIQVFNFYIHLYLDRRRKVGVGIERMDGKIDTWNDRWIDLYRRANHRPQDYFLDLTLNNEAVSRDDGNRKRGRTPSQVGCEGLIHLQYIKKCISIYTF